MSASQHWNGPWRASPRAGQRYRRHVVYGERRSANRSRWVDSGTLLSAEDDAAHSSMASGFVVPQARSFRAALAACGE